MDNPLPRNLFTDEKFLRECHLSGSAVKMFGYYRQAGLNREGKGEAQTGMTANVPGELAPLTANYYVTLRGRELAARRQL